MTKIDFWEYIKNVNDVSYQDGVCEHKDKMVAFGKLVCRSCKKEEDWSGKNYSFTHR